MIPMSTIQANQLQTRKSESRGLGKSNSPTASIEALQFRRECSVCAIYALRNCKGKEWCQEEPVPILAAMPETSPRKRSSRSIRTWCRTAATGLKTADKVCCTADLHIQPALCFCLHFLLLAFPFPSPPYRIFSYSLLQRG